MASTTDKSLRNKLIYQVFVRNYSTEGTFKAVQKDLQRIKELGVDIIYLLPIHPIGEKARKGSLGSPYAIKDYRAVNPEYGTLEDFVSLVNAIHANGMKCMIDVVYNHTSPDSVLAAEHPEWFYHKADGSFGNRVGDWTDIIDLDYSHKELWNYQIETLKYWAQWVDGFRCDVAPMVPVEFWLAARAEVESVRPGCIWLAESVEPGFITYMAGQNIKIHTDSEMFEAFDISYDYDIYNEFTGFLQGKNSLETYANAINHQEELYPDNYVKLRFLENHDKDRAAYLIKDVKALENFTAFSFFQKGAAFVYAGQEFGATHLPTLFDKDTVSLKPENGIDFTELISTLSFIKKYLIFRDSRYHVTADGNFLVAVHEMEDHKAVGIFSVNGQPGEVSVPLADGAYEDQLTGDFITIKGGKYASTGSPVIML